MDITKADLENQLETYLYIQANSAAWFVMEGKLDIKFRMTNDAAEFEDGYYRHWISRGADLYLEKGNEKYHVYVPNKNYYNEVREFLSGSKDRYMAYVMADSDRCREFCKRLDKEIL
jgi:hypothetical protein